MAAQQKTFYGTGRRKSSSARVFISKSSGEASKFVVNKQAMESYFKHPAKQKSVLSVLETADRLGKYDVSITVSGGGYSGQAGAVRHGLARALETAEPELRPALKKAGYLTRDSRVVERKKYGHHKARKSTQFSKR